MRLLAVLLLAASSARAADPPPLRGVLVRSDSVKPAALAEWKARGVNALVVPLDEALPRARWSAIAADAQKAGLALYAWVEVARNPAMAEAHPDWMASPGGHHDDWRRLFPAAPKKKENEAIKAWPWVPIGYAPAFDAHRDRVRRLLGGLPGPWAGVFLNDLQAGPSSCGCGNARCRWALDYGSPATAAKRPGDDAAARFVEEVRRTLPDHAVIPVWVTECELGDAPRAKGGTGLCGDVGCYTGDCWPRYARSWTPLAVSTPGPIALAAWDGTFRLRPDWPDAALRLFLSPPRGGPKLPPERAIVVLQGWGDPARPLDSVTRATGPVGRVLALDPIDQSWEPRAIPIR